MKLALVIFDLDGTILDNEDEYGLAFKKILRKLGKGVSDEFPHQEGKGVRGNWEWFLKNYNLKTKKTAEELAKQTQDEYLKLIKRVKVRDHFLELIRDLRKEGYKTALATSNTWSMVEIIFDRFGIEKLFDVVTTTEEVTVNKPDPEIFLRTADKLDVDPTQCLVFEDSEAGVKAAKEAGMKVVGVARDAKHKNRLSLADMVITNYRQITDKTWQDLKK